MNDRLSLSPSFYSPLLLLLVTLAILAPPGNGCGMGTHNMIGHRALQYFNSSGSPTYSLLASYINSYQGTFQAGLAFPDWGYSCKNFGNESEAAHWPPFLEAATNYLVAKYGSHPEKWSTDGQRLAVFLLGIASHLVADVSWHSLAGFNEGFIEAMAELDFFGYHNSNSYATAHPIADMGGDIVLAYQFDLDWLLVEWYVPASDIVNVYHSLGYSTVTYFSLLECTTELFVGLVAVKEGGKDLFPYYAMRSAFLVEQYNDYFFGGVDDMAVWTTYCWPAVVDWMTNPGLNTPFCIMGGNGNGNTEAKSASNEDSHFSSRGPHGYSSELVAKFLPDVVSSVQSRLQTDTKSSESGIQLRVKENRTVSAPSPPLDSSNVVYQTATAYVNTPYAYLGTSLGSVDVNGDGIDDLVVSAPGWGHQGAPGLGAVYIVFGGAGVPESWPLQMDLEKMSDVIVRGNEIHARFGSVVVALDFNKDGIQDLVVSAPSSGNRQAQYYGTVFVFFGSAQGGRWSVGASPDLSIQGSEVTGTFGTTLASMDLNEDGAEDLVVGAPYAPGDGIQKGRVAVFFAGEGRKTNQRLSINDGDWIANGTTDSEWFGLSLSSVVIPRDRTDQHSHDTVLLLVGSPTYTNMSAIVYGSPTVYPPSNVGKLTAFYLGPHFDKKSTPVPLLELTGKNDHDRLGSSLSVGIPANSTSLLVLSLPTSLQDGNSGVGSVLLLPLGDIISQVGMLRDGAQQDVARVSMDSIDPVTTISGNQFMEHFGLKAAFVGLNKNSTQSADSLFVCSPWGSGNSVYMWKGGAGFPTGVRSVSTADSAFTRKQISGSHQGVRFGSSVAFPDLDGDGIRDVVVASNRDSSFATLGGAVDIFLSST